MEKSTLPSRNPMGGMMMSATNDVMIAPNAAPMMTAVARSTTLPRMTKSRKSLPIVVILPRPEPSERARRQERVEQPVHRGPDGRAPGAAVPDRQRPQRERVPHEGGGSDELEHAEVRRARGQCAPRNVSGEDTDDNGEEEPEHQLPPHRDGAVREHGDHHCRSFAPLGNKLGRAHFRHA